MKKHYTVKKQKDGDYEVTLHNQTKTFSLKEVTLAMMETTKQLKQLDANRRLTKATIHNITNGKDDAVRMFKKLPSKKQAIISSYIDAIQHLQKDEILYADVKKRHNRLKNDLESIHAVIPADDKKLTKSEQRRINSMK